MLDFGFHVVMLLILSVANVLFLLLLLLLLVRTFHSTYRHFYNAFSMHPQRAPASGEAEAYNKNGKLCVAIAGCVRLCQTSFVVVVVAAVCMELHYPALD